jgi:1-hydroxycarotenoid 3,4-desaturase
MLIAHVEQDGVWLVEGGMHRIAAALAAVASRHGASFRYGAHAEEILVRQGRAAGVRLAGGEQVTADVVISNADSGALAAGLLGPDASRAVPRQAARSLSAVTWAMVAKARGFPLSRHTVFFSGDYAAEFRDLLDRGTLPAEPTVYVCAQDRDDSGEGAAGPERLLVLVNAPPDGDRGGADSATLAACRDAAFGLMRRCGLRLTPLEEVVTTQREWEGRFPGTGGALYGAPPHGWAASFARPGARTALPGLYLAGGGAHPGAGVPMAAMSGRLAVESIVADLGTRMRRAG